MVTQARPAPIPQIRSSDQIRFYRLVATVSAPLIRVIFRPTIRGSEHVPATGGFVLSANQLSNLDGWALAYSLLPRQLHWMGKAELFNPISGPFVRGLGIFPVRRGEGDRAAVQRAIDLARSGRVVVIFPEGTRREKGFRKHREARPHSGAARVALAAGVPLVPAAIRGTERLTRLRQWHVAFGPPIELDGLGEKGAAREATRRLWSAIVSLERDLRSVARRQRRLYPRLLLDITVRDLVLGQLACVLAWRRERLARRVLAGGLAGDLVCFSVRTGFDLLLEALALPKGSEIVFSALTHPDMPRIAGAHGLRAIPVDIDLHTLAPRLDLLERALSDRTRVVVVAHLFGSRVDLGPIAGLARRRGLLLVEDCAQGLREGGQQGDGLADVSMFSFGTIKTATALGGALLRVSDPDLAARMRAAQESRPVESRRCRLAKDSKILVLVLIGRPRLYALLARLVPDLDGLVNRSVRAFPGDALLGQIRQRPSAPLLWLLAWRVRAFDGQRVLRRAEAGEDVLAKLPAGLMHPGADALDRTHWVFPVLADRPDELVARLRAEGFDAARATSGIAAVAAPPDRPHLRPVEAERIMRSVVFLPVYPELAADERERMLEVIR
jgi:dTDP-4-amino-4,6-dideoxygalactose transaminase